MIRYGDGRMIRYSTIDCIGIQLLNAIDVSWLTVTRDGDAMVGSLAATDGGRTAEPIPCHVEYASCLARQIQATRLFWKFRERTNLNLEKASHRRMLPPQPLWKGHVRKVRRHIHLSHLTF